MAGLESLTGDDPSGNESQTQGDDRIRELTQKVKVSVSKEHTLSGIHTILSGSSVHRPPYGNKGRFYILETNRVATELQYDTGSAWVTITKNQEVIDDIANLVSHQESNPIDHAEGSITRDILATGILAKKHFGQSFANDNNTVKPLIDGSELDSTWHTHPKPSISTTGAPTFLTNVVILKSGTTTNDTPTISGTFEISDGDVPDGAVAVILEASGNYKLNTESSSVSPRIKITGRKLSGNNIVETAPILLIGGSVQAQQVNAISGITSIGWKGQGIFPVVTTSTAAGNRKMSYEVNDFNDATLEGNGFKIRLVGYI